MELKYSAEEATPNVVAHRLPCTVHSDGPAPTARAFSPFPQPLTSFRGRQLQSGQFSIPPSSLAVFVQNLEEDAIGVSPESASTSSVQIKFKVDSNGLFYQHDDIPDEHSAIPRALQWISISDALHAPVGPEQYIPQTKQGEQQ